MKALEDPVSRRYLPLYTFQSLVIENKNSFEVMQSSIVCTRKLFNYIKRKDLANMQKGRPSFTSEQGDAYRIVTVEKLRNYGIEVHSVINT